LRLSIRGLSLLLGEREGVGVDGEQQRRMGTQAHIIDKAHGRIPGRTYTLNVSYNKALQGVNHLLEIDY